MKSIILTFIFLLISLLPAGAVKKFEANPINVAVLLVEKGDSANIDGMFKYYGYTLQGTEDGYNIMKDGNGNEIRYTFNENGITSQYPTIEVKANETYKHLDSLLKDLNFIKNDNVYERTVNRYQNWVTKCKINSHNKLTFQRIKRQIPKS